MLTGQPPFRAENTTDLFQMVLHDEPPSPRKIERLIPRDLETICLKCLQKDIGKRYQTAQEVVDELKRFLGGEPILARPIGRMERAWAWCRRRPWIAGLSAATVVSLLIGTVVSLYFAWKADQRAREADVNAGLFKNARNEAQLRALDAERSALEARRHAYANQMTLAQIALEVGDPNRARTLLRELIPQSGEKDLREFDWYCLAHLLESELTAFEGHRGRIACVAASPQGDWFATGGFDSDIRFWNLRNGKRLATLSEHGEVVLGMAFSPDGHLLVSGSGDRTVRVWDVRDRKHPRPIHFLSGQERPVLCVAFSPDGRFLAAGGEKVIQIWDVKTFQLVATLSEHSDFIRSVVFSPNSKLLASCSSDGTIRIWDTATTTPLKVIGDHTSIVHSLDFSPDGRLLASGSWDQTVKLWNTQDWSLKTTLSAEQGMVRCVRFSPDGQTLVAAGEGHDIQLWNVGTGQAIGRLQGHQGLIWNIAFCGSDDTLVSVGERRRIEADESSHGNSSDVKVWDLTTLKERPISRNWAERSRLQWLLDTKIFAIDVNRAGTKIFAAQEDSRISEWDLRSGKQTGTFFGHQHFVTTLDLSPNGRILASGGQDGTVRLWDVESRVLRRSIVSEYRGVAAVAISPDNQFVAANDEDGLVAIWNIATGIKVQALTGYDGEVTAVSFSPDGRWLAAGGQDGRICMWDIATGKTFHQFSHEKGAITSVTFSPSGKVLASAGSDQTARLWNISTRTAIVLEGHLNQVTDVAFTLDGTRIATASQDKTIKLWDVETGHELTTLRGQRDEISDIEFSSDGQSLIAGIKGFSGRSVGQIVVWRAPRSATALNDNSD